MHVWSEIWQAHLIREAWVRVEIDFHHTIQPTRVTSTAGPALDTAPAKLVLEMSSEATPSK